MNHSTPNEREELVHRWIDGELDPAENARLEKLFAEDPELLAEAKSLKSLHVDIGESLPVAVEPPYPDFFNSQIQKRIVEDASRAASPVKEAKSGIFSFFSLPWAVAAAALVAAVVALVGKPSGSESGSAFSGLELAAAEHGRSSVSTTYAPVAGVTATSFFSEEAEATVIRLEGLDALDDSIGVDGQQAASYIPDANLAGGTAIYDQSGALLMVLVDDANGGPPTFFER